MANLGWVSLSCQNTASSGTAQYGVTNDGGVLGWIHFASSGAHPFRMKTAWTCSVLNGVPQLVLSKFGADVQLDRTLPPGATASDVIRGDLSTLRSTAGDYALATLECVADNELGTTWLRPAVGADEWLLVRSADCGGGSYDTAGAGQLGTRNGGIEASGLTCP